MVILSASPLFCSCPGYLSHPRDLAGKIRLSWLGAWALPATALQGDILVVGSCACDEAGGALAQRYPDRRIYLVPEHNDLMTNTHYQARLMGVTPVTMVPLNPLVSAFTLVQAKLHGLTARCPSWDEVDGVEEVACCHTPRV